MTKYFFILGRNPELSKAELYSYLEARSIKSNLIFQDENILVLEFEKDIILNIQEFGGLLKLGKIQFEGNINEFEKFLEKNELIEKDKFTYSILGNGEEGYLIQKFKEEKRKAIIRHGRKGIKMQGGRDIVLIPNAEVEFFFHEDKKITYFGIVEQDYSYEEIKKRDMQKPVRRESLAISPRLAKILINLSQVKEKGLLLDPFCGVGGILQEGIIKNIRVFGSDIDTKAIENAKRNFKWIEQEFKIKGEYQFQQGDSRNLKNLQCDGIATEPQLGEVIREKLPQERAQFFIQKFQAEIIPILQRLRQIKKSNAKIAITFPVIKGISPNLDEIEKKTDLKVYKLRDIKFPIKESRPDQFVSREIVVLL